MNPLAPWLAAVAVAVSACSDAPPSKESRQVRVQERLKKAEFTLGQTPQPRSYRFDGNELKVIDVPVADGSGFLENQRCFVWRDSEFRTATLSCPQAQEMVVADPAAEMR
jgi:hypothetical protein